MKKWIFFPSLFFLLLRGAFFTDYEPAARAAGFANTKTLVLYDASSGDIPDKSRMSFTDFPPGAASLTYVDGETLLDTTPSGNDTLAGWVSSQATTTGFPILDQTTGVQVNFTLQIESEAHANNNRAGFSVILLDQAARGIELSFWENEIWAQNDNNTGGLFTHGEGITFASTNTTDYQLTITGDRYVLTLNSQPLLIGPVRDYSSFSGFPDPYETSNFLFMGDDTTSSQARIRLRFVSIAGTEPVAPTVTDSGTSPSTPPSTASPLPLPSATLIAAPTSTPASRVIDLCPSGWLLGIVMIPGAMMIRKNRTTNTKF